VFNFGVFNFGVLKKLKCNTDKIYKQCQVLKVVTAFYCTYFFLLFIFIEVLKLCIKGIPLSECFTPTVFYL